MRFKDIIKNDIILFYLNIFAESLLKSMMNLYSILYFREIMTTLRFLYSIMSVIIKKEVMFFC
jgi:hypothetical protein